MYVVVCTYVANVIYHFNDEARGSKLPVWLNFYRVHNKDIDQMFASITTYDLLEAWAHRTMGSTDAGQISRFRIKQYAFGKNAEQDYPTVRKRMLCAYVYVYVYECICVTLCVRYSDVRRPIRRIGDR